MHAYSQNGGDFMVKVFIDGSAGTTGLQIHERLQARKDLELLTIPEELRKDAAARSTLMNEASVVFLCLPDAAAIEAVPLVTNPDTCIIDTSTAHRTSPDWAYGFPELGNAAEIAASKRIANPGCHATGFVSVVYPLVAQGLLPKDIGLTCFSLTGYSGGGKKMIAEYEAEDKPEALYGPGIYGLTQKHKHIPEMVKVCGLQKKPIFCPIVDDYLKGMASTVSFRAEDLGGAGPEQVRQAYEAFYAGQQLVTVASAEEAAALARLHANTKAGTDSLKLFVTGNEELFTVTALFDNLGKGASGAAIENMNLVLGLNPATGLVV